LIIWQICNPALLWIKKGMKYHWDSKFNGLNIGCGIYNPTNWVGIDGGITHLFIHFLPKYISKWSFKYNAMNAFHNFEDYYKKIKSIRFIHYDIRFGLPFKDENIPNIYSSHFLEHIEEKEAEELLKECFRVMKEEAIIRIVVPSIENEIRIINDAIIEYKKGNILKIQKILTNSGSDYISKFSTHKHMYNFPHLKEKLEIAGFVNVVECGFKKGSIIDVELLDTRENSLYVEASKPEK
jgi:SAM-dependent methyltransferase